MDIGGKMKLSDNLYSYIAYYDFLREYQIQEYYHAKSND